MLKGFFAILMAPLLLIAIPVVLYFQVKAARRLAAGTAPRGLEFYANLQPIAMLALYFCFPGVGDGDYLLFNMELSPSVPLLFAALGLSVASVVVFFIATSRLSKLLVKAEEHAQG